MPAIISIVQPRLSATFRSNFNQARNRHEDSPVVLHAESYVERNFAVYRDKLGIRRDFQPRVY